MLETFMLSSAMLPGRWKSTPCMRLRSPPRAVELREPLSASLILAEVVIEGAEHELTGIPEPRAVDHRLEVFATQKAVPDRQVQPRQLAIAQHGAEHHRAGKQVQAAVSQIAERAHQRGAFHRRAVAGEDDLNAAIFQRMNTRRIGSLAGGNIDRLPMLGERRVQGKIEAAACDRDRGLYRQAVLLSPFDHVSSLPGGVDLQHVAELSPCEPPQVPSVGDQAVGLRVELLQQSEVVCVRQTFEELRF